MQADFLLIYVADDAELDVGPLDRLAGMAIAERVLRAAARAGYARVWVWAPRSGPAIATLLRRHPRLRQMAEVVTDAATWGRALADTPQDATIIGPGTLASPALLVKAREAAPGPDEIVEIAAGDLWPESGVFRCSAGEVTDAVRLTAMLRKRRQCAHPYPSGQDIAEERALLSIRVRNTADLASAEQTLRRATYKATDGYLARFNRTLSLPLSVALVPTGITANAVSMAILVLGFSAAWLFSHGTYSAALLGALISLAASILDGCDGEIARLKYEDSRLGCWIETVGDYSYYIAIFAGMAIGAARDTGYEAFYWIGAFAGAGMLLGFALLVFLRRRITGSRPDRLPAIMLDRFLDARQAWTLLLATIWVSATRSTMPYGILALAIFDLIPVVIVLGAIGAHVYWISLAIKLNVLCADGRREAVG